MDMSGNFRPEFHIAQQSRRDKLRIQNDSGVYVSNLDQINAQYNLPYGYCSEMANFPVNSQGILAERVNLMVHQESDDKRVGNDAAASLGNFCRTNPYTFSTPLSTGNGDPQYFSTWKSIGSQSTSDWVPHQTPIFVGDGLSASSFKLICNNSTTPPMESHCPNNDLSSAIPIPNSYQNPLLQELVVSSSNNVQSFGLELGQRSCADESGSGGWVLDQFRCKSQSDLISRAAEMCPEWGGHLLNYAAGKNGDGDLRKGRSDKSNTQALSLSLSSVPSPKVQTTQITEKYSTTDGSLDNIDVSRDLKPENLSGNLSKVLGVNGRQDLGTLARRHPGPLGPFTGYATILRSSKFLRPAQQLLDELCCFSRSKNVDTYSCADKALEEVRVSGEVCNTEALVRSKDDYCGSTFVINDSNGKTREPGGMICSTDSFQPESLQKKAKLLCMQDEVCKRYKQYHQQMQMVVSSFESVAGLSGATPYVSFALKMVSKHFRCLKNAITEQLKSVRNSLGEEKSSPGAGTSGSKVDTGVSMLKFFDQSIQKQNRAGSAGSIVDGQHIWRPQRGLPERAVSILRAWLFDHFLHPYPTDTDKHMLASQTGLTRNQVSNWFINARVRLWKPMVEEIHMLETKGMSTEPGSDTAKPTIEGCNQTNNTAESFNMLGASSMIPDKHVECTTIHPSEHQADRLSGIGMWNHDKRSRIEYHGPPTVGGSLMGFVPGIEIGGLGAVSLTLGLRQSVENAAQRPTALQQEHHFRSRFGGQIIRDFVG